MRSSTPAERPTPCASARGNWRWVAPNATSRFPFRRLDRDRILRGGGSSDSFVSFTLVFDQLPKFFPCLVQPRPDGADGDVLNSSDLLPRVTLDLEEDEGRHQLAMHLGDHELELPARLGVLEISGRAVRVVRHLAEIHLLPPQHEISEPGTPAVIANRELRDSIQPARQIPSVEAPQVAANDDEDLLSEILGVRARGAEGIEPPHHVVEPPLVDFPKLDVTTRVGALRGGRRLIGTRRLAAATHHPQGRGLGAGLGEDGQGSHAGCKEYMGTKEENLHIAGGLRRTKPYRRPSFRPGHPGVAGLARQEPGPTGTKLIAASSM